MPDTTHSYIIDNDEANESLLIHDIARLSKICFDRKVRTLNLTRAQWLILSTLRRNPGINQAQLAERLDVRPITVARTLDRMERDGWIERKACAHDRRINQLYLAPRAQDVVTQMRALAMQMRMELLAGMTEDEHRQFLTLLKKIKHNITTVSKVTD